MTTMAMTESFDAPMMDFSGEDILMQTSSSTSWNHPEATMDDDSNFHLGDGEIDMYPEPFEYEMADDSSAEQPLEVHDIEVVDVSQAHTPALIDTVVEDVTAASPAVPEHDLTDTHDLSPLESPPTLFIQVPSPTPQPAQTEENHGIAGVETLGHEWDQGRSEPLAASPPPHPTECHQSQAQSTNIESATEPTPTWDIGAPKEQQEHLRQPTPTPVEQLRLDSSHEELAHDLADNWGDDENPVPSHASWGDPHEVSDEIFVDPPPPVILTLGDSEEEYYLFNRPTHKPPAVDGGGVTDDALFLHDLPTLYYEPLAKVFQALRLDGRLARRFDLSRGELVIDAYDLDDLVISEDNSYTNEVSFHDLNLFHDQAALNGPLRIRVECNPQRFITRFRELKSNLEQFSLLDEANPEDSRFGEHYDLPEQPGAHNDSDYLAQNEQADENSTSEGHDQATTEHQPDDPGSAAHAVDHFDEGDSSNDADPEQEQPADDTESTVGPLSGDERTEQPVGVAEEDREQGAAIVANSDGGYPGPAEDPNAAAVHEHPDDHDVAPFGENSTGHEEVVPTNDDYESDYNENDQDSVHGDTVAIEGDAGDADWATTTPDAQHTQGNLERHKDQDAEEADKHSDPIDLNAPDDDDDYNTGQQDTDTDSLGQRTLDEFADAQEETQDDPHPREGVESNNTTEQYNELNPDLDQFEDGFNWDEDFGDDPDGEFDEFEDRSNMETKRASSQEPTSGKSSKRGFDEIDSDTADEEDTQGDVSPNSKRKKVL